MTAKPEDWAALGDREGLEVQAARGHPRSQGYSIATRDQDLEVQAAMADSAAQVGAEAMAARAVAWKSMSCLPNWQRVLRYPHAEVRQESQVRGVAVGPQVLVAPRVSPEAYVVPRVGLVSQGAQVPMAQRAPWVSSETKVQSSVRLEVGRFARGKQPSRQSRHLNPAPGLVPSISPSALVA